MENSYRECQESNWGLLGEEQEFYLSAMQPPVNGYTLVEEIVHGCQWSSCTPSLLDLMLWVMLLVTF